MLGEEEVGILDVLRIRTHVCRWGSDECVDDENEGWRVERQGGVWMGLLDGR